MPQDSIGVRYIVVSQGSPLYQGASIPAERREPIIPSPDGESFFFMMCHGELDSDSNICELRVYRVADVRAWLAKIGGPHPPLMFWRNVVQRSYSSLKPPIFDARWDAESSSILYWGLDDDDQETPQVRRLNLRTGEVKQLTEHGKSKHDFSRWFTYSNGSLVYNGYQEKEATARYPMETVQLSAQGSVMSTESREINEARISTGSVLYVANRGGRPRRLNAKASTGGVWISPDGRKAVIRAQQGGPEQQEFVLVDLERNSVRP
ncbi:MAG TPA: hypothetical protein VJ180_05570, partial [Pyrinomonadaceae bacterium]|nr:hypothetical protein [Pyrinomonadaceae bacterium]